MIRLRLSIDLHYDVLQPDAAFIFNLQCAQTPCQRVVQEQLQVSQPIPLLMHTDAASQSRYLRLSAAPGVLRVGYRALLDLHHHAAAPASIEEVPVARLPPEVLTYIYPSRYCPSDQMGTLALQHFGALPRGYARVEAIQRWVQQQIRFTPNSSNATTSALDTLRSGAGVCRDFAHLMIALCRALSIPARIATGIDYGADPALGPTDFHAYVEVFLGQHWYLFDPSGTAIPMGFVRIGTGRDAADVSFATIIGNVRATVPPVLAIEALQDAAAGWVLPHHRTEALSTSAGVF
ncbi:transglutaminase family protein [Viridibacterium curvum]|uniref:Transglutaminase family protein n=1 Tax=Viridibacterium curvum TaxID=1101404 RepID=A0ABP9QPT0_9RHOO